MKLRKSLSQHLDNKRPVVIEHTQKSLKRIRHPYLQFWWHPKDVLRSLAYFEPTRGIHLWPGLCLVVLSLLFFGAKELIRVDIFSLSVEPIDWLRMCSSIARWLLICYMLGLLALYAISALVSLLMPISFDVVRLIAAWAMAPVVMFFTIYWMFHILSVLILAMQMCMESTCTWGVYKMILRDL